MQFLKIQLIEDQTVHVKKKTFCFVSLLICSIMYICIIIISSTRQSLIDWIYMYRLLFHYLGICSLFDRTQCLLKGSCLVQNKRVEYWWIQILSTHEIWCIESHEINRYRNKNDNNELSTYHQTIFKVTHTHYNYGKKRERKTIEWKTMPFSIILRLKTRKQKNMLPCGIWSWQKRLRFVEWSFYSS